MPQQHQANKWVFPHSLVRVISLHGDVNLFCDSYCTAQPSLGVFCFLQESTFWVPWWVAKAFQEELLNDKYESNFLDMYLRPVVTYRVE